MTTYLIRSSLAWILAWILLLTNIIAAAQSTVKGAPDTQNNTTQSLHSLFDTEWEYQMQQHPVTASLLGDRRWNNVWEDVSLGAIERRHNHDIEILRRLDQIKRNELSSADQLNFDLFKQQYETSVEGYTYRWYLVPINHQNGIQTSSELAESLRFETEKDYQDWIGRLNSFPVYVDQTIALMREGIKSRVLLPKAIMQRITRQIENQIVTDPALSPYFKPFKSFTPQISNTEQAHLSASAQQAITKNIVPAFRRFKDFFVSEYLPASFDQSGIWQIPNGDQMYAFFVRQHTTTKMAPQEIHEVGLREVRRIHAEMNKILQQVGFSGTLQDFFKYLRTDERFYYKSPEELFVAYEAMTKRIDPKLVKMFTTLPRTPYGVEPIPMTSAPDTTTAYYMQPAADGSRAGTYYVNLYKPETRPKWEMMALSLHESVPGHHLQIALAMEQGGIPKFRRYGDGYTAFVEGWGLYAESLGDEMGLYTDPYLKFGQLTYEMWRAVRLVIDTGIHYLHWDRQKAIDFFLANAAKQELDVTNEVDRYISWPGQALAYKIGELRIKSLRAKAAQTLGSKFDLREFHDVVLSSGAVPLDILEEKVNSWVEKSR